MSTPENISVENPPAFPLHNWDTISWPSGTSAGFGTGMSLREYYKAKAISAAADLWFNSPESQRMIWSGCKDKAVLTQRDFPRFIANVCGWIADAQLEETARQQSNREGK